MEIIVIALVFGALAIAQSALLGRLGLRGFSYERRFFEIKNPPKNGGLRMWRAWRDSNPRPTGS